MIHFKETNHKEYKLVECDCHSPHHTWYLSYDPGDEKWPAEFYLNTQLIQYRSFFKRIWTAIKYVFKRGEVQGHWDCSLMTPEKALDLASWIIYRAEEVPVHE